MTLGIIPLTAQINDTDLDGIPNASDPAPTVNAVVSDPDGNNNLPASFQTGLIGRWDFQTLAISGANHRFADLAGGDQPLDCRQLSMSIDQTGMISKAALFDGANDHLAAAGSLFHNRSAFSTTLWFKMTPGSVEERFGSTTFLACNGALDSYPELIISITRAGRGPGQTISVSRFSGATQTRSFSGQTQTGDFLDDGYWHHLAYVKNGNNQRLFLNGVKIAESSLTSANFTATTARYICYGKNIPNATDQGHTFRGSMDRIRFYSRNLSDTEVSHLYLQDSDRDGFPDIVEKDWAATYPSLSPYYWQSPDADTDGDTIPDNWEHNNGLDPTNPNDAYDDPDYDGILNQYEFLLGFHPNNPNTNGTSDIIKDRDGDGLKDWQEAATGTFQWNIELQKYIFIKVLDWEVKDANSDFDQDGLTNALELINATDLTNWDSDGDLLPDGWEVQHGLNPLNNSGVNGATGDFDGDGLSNLDELMYGSKPNTIDSDGDGTNDQQEAQQGSNPNNNTDQGQAPPPETTVDVPFRIGDPSGSHSERWKLTIQGDGPDDNRKIEFVSPDFGEMGEKTFKLRKANKYTITVTHVATNEEDSPDYDWEAQIDGKPISESNEETPIQPGTNNYFVVKEHWLVDNREAVLTTEKHGDDENIVAGKKATLLPVDIVPDYNRDGKIDQEDRGKVAEDDPWRWWVNDDKDDGDYAADEESDVPGLADGNFSDGSINGVTDLTDFFPIFLNIKHALVVFPPGEYDYKLRQDDGALNFAEAPDLIPDDDPDYDGAGAYWRSAFWAENYKNLPVRHITAIGVSLSHSFLDKLKGGRGILLLEYRKASGAPLQLEIWKDSRKLTTIDFHSKADKVENMYRHLNLYEATGTLSSQLNDTGEPSNYPDDKTNEKAFVMIHGYAPRGHGAKNDRIQRGFQSEIFRRLHQAGSKAKFVAVYWDSATGLDYHKAVYQAFKTSPFVGQGLGFLSGNEITVGAHSLGNIVTSNAICHEGFRPKNYFLINAASPIESYNPTQTHVGDIDMKSAMTEREWKPYDERFHSPNWHACFPANDNRSKLKWKARFSNISELTNPFNFYSTGEDVVANSEPGEDNFDLFRKIWKRVGENEALGRYSWVGQEFIKGGTSIAAGIAFERNHGGWAFNGRNQELRFMVEHNPLDPPGTYQFPLPNIANPRLNNGDIVEEHLAQFGLFKRFESRVYEPLYAPINDANKNWTDAAGFAWQNPHTQAQGSALAGQKDTQWVILATAMPSVSFAAAANAVGGIDGFDMNDHTNGWPNLPARGQYLNDWQHGDFVSIGASYVKKMYEKAVEKGVLDD